MILQIARFKNGRHKRLDGAGVCKLSFYKNSQTELQTRRQETGLGCGLGAQRSLHHHLQHQPQEIGIRQAVQTRGVLCLCQKKFGKHERLSESVGPATGFNGRSFILQNIERKDVQPGLAINTASTPGSEGITLELCAGICDKAIPPIEIAMEEVLEECGYKVPKKNIELVTSCLGGVGTSGETAHYFYAEVNDSMKDDSNGGGVAEEGEMIETVELTVEEAKEKLLGNKRDDVVKCTAATLFGLMWFMTNKADEY